ncbi:MAG: gamma-glutamylcyclotransferase [Gemmobacter sp.]
MGMCEPMTQAAMWVFGYGSLIWDPGFAVAERRVARVRGWHRSFCMRSVHYRGSATAPGLVLALDRAEGASCDGVALRVPAGAEEATLAYLRERELISYAYLETTLPCVLQDGPEVMAVSFVINQANDQYCGRLTPEDQASIIAASHGVRGPNRDYLYATVAHLAGLGIADAELAALAARVREIAGD